MGFFSQKKAAPSGTSSRTASGGRKSASDAPSVPVPNPGFPEGDLGFIGVKLFEACGLSVVSFSSKPIAEHFTEIARVAPTFLRSSANQAGAGQFIGYEPTGTWIAWDSPAGSLVATHCYPDGDSMFLIQQINDPIATAGPGVEWSIAVSGQVPAPVAEILTTGRPIPAWDLPGLDALRPAPVQGAQVPELLVQRLNEAGWEQINESLFKAVVNAGNERTQVVFFGSWNAGNFACMSPVAHAENGQLPEQLRGLSYEQYRLDVVADLVMLVHPMPAGPPSPTLESLNNAAVDLATFADRVEGDLSASDEF